jgi:hypothetical protein
MSKNHQYYEFEQDIVERWVKTVPHMVSGKRFNPYSPSQTIDFVLKTATNNFNYDKASKSYTADTKVTFVYEDEVLELYSDNEARLFKRLNKGLIERGLLKPYVGVASEVDTSNTLSDDEIDTIASMVNLLAFKKRIGSITSMPTLDRLQSALIRLDRKASFVTALQEYRAGYKN